MKWNIIIKIFLKKNYYIKIRRIEIQENKLINHAEPVRMVLKSENINRFKSTTFKQS